MEKIEVENPIKINLCLKGKAGKLHRIAVRYYVAPVNEGDRKEEKYIYTEYRILKADFEAKRPSEDLVDLRKMLNDKIKACKEKCGKQLNFERFKLAWDGTLVVEEKPKEKPNLLQLLDKHLELNAKNLLKEKPYQLSTKDMYGQYRRLLERIHYGVPEKGLPAKPLYCDQFATKQAFKELENDTITYAARGMGRTRVAMVMQRIKTICNTGYDPELDPKHMGDLYQCIPNDAYRRYTKPKESVGTVPVAFNDFNKIFNYKPSRSANQKEFQEENLFVYGRDFWCFMVQAGGMESKDIALLRWPKVNEIEGYFSYTRSKIEEDADGDIMISYVDYPHLVYMIKEYGVQENKFTGSYVFNILKDGMTAEEQDAAIQNFYTHITKIMGKLSEKLGIKNKATCKRARPTFACNAMENGMDIYTISKMMGHKNVKTTEIYLKNLPTKAKLQYSKKAASVYNKAA